MFGDQHWAFQDWCLEFHWYQIEEHYIANNSERFWNGWGYELIQFKFRHTGTPLIVHRGLAFAEYESPLAITAGVPLLYRFIGRRLTSDIYRVLYWDGMQALPCYIVELHVISLKLHIVASLWVMRWWSNLFQNSRTTNTMRIECMRLMVAPAWEYWLCRIKLILYPICATSRKYAQVRCDINWTTTSSYTHTYNSFFDIMFTFKWFLALSTHLDYMSTSAWNEGY